MVQLNDRLVALPGIGPKTAEKFEKLGISEVGHLLHHYPFRYEDFESKSVLELMDGEKAVIVGQVVTPANLHYYGSKKNRLRFSIKQGEIVVAVSFFNQPYLIDKVLLGQEIVIWGKWDKLKSSLTGMKILAQVGQDLQPIYRLAQGIS